MQRTGTLTVPISGTWADDANHDTVSGRTHESVTELADLTDLTEPTGPTSRLAELVAALTDCPPPLAADAVERSIPPCADPEHDGLSADERLAVVAGALVRLRHDLDIRERRRPA
jgi:hypothetical protein